ncbi:hypothetical protein BT96DRAFT_971707 [Gymnopus androsaceus JB14]|uniref:Protein kinase domain-containing protein n=1 Tax=Gymnopus androsaceus JB14 TaxID=1447944 RepID=A0A6A4I481_9AGAR|nr:hypothetical protein BT96DRAFT_971707 [Gymnopus androsaceus JB14]
MFSSGKQDEHGTLLEAASLVPRASERYQSEKTGSTVKNDLPGPPGGGFYGAAGMGVGITEEAVVAGMEVGIMAKEAAAGSVVAMAMVVVLGGLTMVVVTPLVMVPVPDMASVSDGGQNYGIFKPEGRMTPNPIVDSLASRGYILSVDKELNSSERYRIAVHAARGNRVFLKKIWDDSKEEHFLRMCKHQNVIDLIESFGMDGATWLAFPFYMALSVGLVHHRPTIRDHAMEITYGIAQGLYFLHSINVADLDVKPHNIVIDANFNARLIDFDCAVHVDGEGRTMTGFVAPNLAQLRRWEEKMRSMIHSLLTATLAALSSMVSGSAFVRALPSCVLSLWLLQVRTLRIDLLFKLGSVVTYTLAHKVDFGSPAITVEEFPEFPEFLSVTQNCVFLSRIWMLLLFSAERLVMTCTQMMYVTNLLASRFGETDLYNTVFLLLSIEAHSFQVTRGMPAVLGC